MIAILIPDRGDRPEFLKNCLRMMENQTLQPSFVLVVGHKPTSDSCDITQRYKQGYEFLSKEKYENKFEVIALIENDDYYAPDYLETMYKGWIKANKPDIYGLNHTIYYHIKEKAFFTMHHQSRSSAMNTLIKPNLDFFWCRDDEPYTDIHLWHTIENKFIEQNLKKEICIGMKHGVGLTGGGSHTSGLHRFTNKDHDHKFLKLVMNDDHESFDFYTNYFN